MKKELLWMMCCLIWWNQGLGRSPSFQTYMNPVIPGDHPDPTLTKIGKYFYTSGSSFNPTPKIYRSTDLVHWEVIAQPVSASWTGYGDSPGGGIWGGHMVLYNGIYWHYFGRGGGSMYFVTADQPEGPWSTPTRVRVPASMPAGLGVDNSIFIDDDGKGYLLTKAGHENNHIVELGEDGQPTGVVLDLTWLNPGPSPYPYGWAEGPVMWKHNGYYYYSFAQHLVGAQYVMRSETLTDEKSAWTIVGTNMFTGPRGSFGSPNHISPAVSLDDGTSWVIAHSYHGTWYAQGRQGLLCQVTYDAQGFPVIQYPSNHAVPSPDLPSGGIPWMVPKSDFFDSDELNPEWSLLGYTSDDKYSLTERPGWLRLHPKGRARETTVVKNDGEHNYSLITRLESEPTSEAHEAGLWVFNGPQNLFVRLCASADASGENVVRFSFSDTRYEIENTAGYAVWLKLVRVNHEMTGYFSTDGAAWSRVGEPINVTTLNIEQTQFNNFTGNRLGLYVKDNHADFDLFIYRDAYTPILAECPANQFGTLRRIIRGGGTVLDNIGDGDWALYAGVEFGHPKYPKSPVKFQATASCAGSGGMIEVWLDSIDTGRKIAECAIGNTGDLNTFQTFSSPVEPVSGRHDVYLRFRGTESDRLFQLQWFVFLTASDTLSGVDGPSPSHLPQRMTLEPNYPNPFNPETRISYFLPKESEIRLVVCDALGREIATLVQGTQPAGRHTAVFDGSRLGSGMYLCILEAGDSRAVRKMMLMK